MSCYCLEDDFKFLMSRVISVLTHGVYFFGKKCLAGKINCSHSVIQL